MLRGLSFTVERGGCLVVTGPNGSGKTTLLRILAGLGDAHARHARRRRRSALALGYLAHEPLLYRELTRAREPRAVRPSLPRRRSGGSGSGCCWSGSASGRRAASGWPTTRAGMVQRLALCRTLLHDPELLVLDEPFTALDDEGAELLDRELEALAGAATLVVSTHDPARVDPLATGGWRSRCDERLPRRRRRADAQGSRVGAARARHASRRCCSSCSPRWSCSTSRCPAGTGDDAAYGLLWVAIVFTSLVGLSRAWLPEGRLGAIDALVLATSDRSAIWVAKTLAALAFLAVAEIVALPAFALLFAPLDAAALAGAVLASDRAVRRRLADLGARVRRARPRGRAAAAAAARSRSRSSWVVSAPRSPPSPAIPALSRSLRPRLRDTFVGLVRVRRHRVGDPTMSTPRINLPAIAIATTVLMGGALAMIFFVAPVDARPGALAEDLLLPRPDRPHRVRVLRARRLEGASRALDTR